MSNSIIDAEKEYQQLVQSLLHLSNEAHPLMGNTAAAAQQRSLLLGRSPHATTTWEELWEGRLRFDVPKEHISINLQDGLIASVNYKPDLPVKCPGEDAKYNVPADLIRSIIVILESYPKSERNRFYNSKGSIRERAIAYMFGLRSGTKKQTTKEICCRLDSLNYHKLREMIDGCIELATITEKDSTDRRINPTKKLKLTGNKKKIGGKVTEAIAKRIYDRIVDPIGEKLVCIDTSLYDGNTLSAMEHFFSDSYLDGKKILKEKNSTKCLNNKNKQQNAPIINSEKVVSENGTQATVAVINNVMSKSAIEEIVNLLNNEKFVYGSGGNKLKTFVRVSSLVGSPFFVSKGNIVYNSVKFTELDYKVKKYFDKLMDFQTKTIEKELGSDFKITTGVNTIHYLVGHFKNAKYVYHSDFGCYLCTNPSEYPNRIYSGVGRSFLPLRPEQQTYTFVITTGTSEPNAKFSYRDHLSGVNLQTFYLDNICAHIQFAHSQEDCFQHGVELLPKCIELPSATRIVITARLCIPKDNPNFHNYLLNTVPQEELTHSENWINDYEHTNVINKLQSLEANLTDHEAHPGKQRNNQQNYKKSTNNNIDVDSKINISTGTLSDRYRKISRNDFDKLNIKCPPSRGTIKHTFSECLHDHRFVHILFRAGYLVETEYTETSPSGLLLTKWRQLIPRLHLHTGENPAISLEERESNLGFIHPGTICNLDYIAQLLGLESSERRHQPYNQTTKNIHRILCSMSYKNKIDMIAEQLRFHNERNEIMTKLGNPMYGDQGYVSIYNPKYGGKQTTYGWGGCPTAMGINAPTPTQDSKHDAGMVFPIGQGLCFPPSISSDTTKNRKNKRLPDDNVAFFNQYYQKGSVFLYFVDEMQMLGNEPKYKHVVSKNIMKQKGANKVCRFMNYMVIHKWSQKEGISGEKLLQKYNKHSASACRFIWFRSNPYNKIVMHPFFSDEDYHLIKTRENENYIYKQLRVPSNSDVRITFSIPAGNPNRLYDVRNKECLFMTTIYREVAHSSLLDQFLINGHEFQNKGGNVNSDMDIQHGPNLSKAQQTMELQTTHEGEDQNIVSEEDDYEEMTTDNLNHYNPILVEAAKESLKACKDTSVASKMQDNAVIAHFSRTMENMLLDEESKNNSELGICNMDLDTVTKEKGTSMSYKDTCIAALFVNAAGAYRYKKMGGCLLHEPSTNTSAGAMSGDVNSVSSKKQDNKVSAPLMVKELGTALRLNSFPMCNRYMDTIPMTLRREAIRRKWIKDDSKHANFVWSDIAQRRTLQLVLFASTLLRFTGRVSRFALYEQWHANKNKTFIPTDSKEVTNFLEFMKATTVKVKCAGHTMSQWISGQHFEAIPKSIRGSFVHTSNFIKNMGAGISTLVEKMHKLSSTGLPKGTDRRLRTIQIMEEQLKRWCIDDSNGNLRFLAQQIISDVEGIFGYLFGEPISSGICAGHAGHLGYIMLVWKMEKKDKPSLAELLNIISDGVQRGTMIDDTWLPIGGYFRDDNGVVVNKINGLPFGCTDIEHWLCKTWILVRKTFNHYRNSMYPVPLEPFYHPIKWPRNNTPSSILKDNIMDAAMKEATDAFEKCVKESANGKTGMALPTILEI